MSELGAHQVSTLTALAAFAGCFGILDRRWPIGSQRDAGQIGVIWGILTVLFEFAFGRAVAGTPWSELLADYDLRRGRLWALVPLWLTVGPTAVRAAKARRSPSLASPRGLRPAE